MTATLNKKHLAWCIEHMDQLATSIKTTDQELDDELGDGFDYRSAIQNDGVYLIPFEDGSMDTDYGDTNSDGVKIDVNPLTSLAKIKEQLYEALCSFMF